MMTMVMPHESERVVALPKPWFRPPLDGLPHSHISLLLGPSSLVVKAVLPRPSHVPFALCPLAWRSSEQLRVMDSSFLQNQAENGGALAAELGAKLYVSRCSFQNNTATTGGAIYGTGMNSSVEMRSSTAVANSATKEGGALQAYELLEFDAIRWTTSGAFLLFFCAGWRGERCRVLLQASFPRHGDAGCEAIPSPRLSVNVRSLPVTSVGRISKDHSLQC